MGICSKCNSPIELNAIICPKCGIQLQPVTKESGTLNVDEHIPNFDSVSLDKNQANEQVMPNSDEQATLNLDVRDNRSLEQNHETGTLRLSDVDAAHLVTPGDSSGTTETIDSPESLRKMTENSDEQVTIRLPDESNSEQAARSEGTVVYSDSELRDALQGKMSERSSGISSGQLKKVWEAAIGSSGKDSKQSLRHDRAEASDSVFRRVATRVVADANTTGGKDADYQIKDKLGEGGMGIVYSAIQTTVNRIVAIKSIRKDKQLSDKSRSQFFYEAEITADLDHPNIPPIYDLGTTNDGLLFYSMKLIDGIEWQKQISKKTREENLEIFKKVADAVAFAHSKDVIHRDLKPDNVMLGKFGEVFVTDWGLAFNMNRNKQVDFGGTPDYMAPEMARHRQAKIGKASDIYLLGAVLFQTLTGSPPHVGKKVLERLAAAERNDIVPAKTDDTLLEIAYRAMATEPSDRYASVEEMQEAIRQIRQHEESITLTHRAEEAAGLAISSKDYGRFTRAIFGFRDAVELWGGNQAALRGLQRARLAYGQCAFDKGDNDLVLQTLDRSVEVEAKLYEKAAKAKAAVEQREQRFKTLRRTFVAAVLTFLCITTGLAGFATLKWRGEAEATLAANESAEKEKIAAKAAIESAEKEKIAAANAETARKEAVASEEVAKVAEMAAKESAKKEKEAADIAEKEKIKAVASEKIAIEAEKAATESAKKENLAKVEAQQRAAQIQLGDYTSKLGLAKLQVEQFDIRGASQLLNDVKGISAEEFGKLTPRFDTWGWQRINLLTNADLPRHEFGSKVTAIDFASGMNAGIAGTEEGKVHLLRYQEGKLTSETSIENPGAKIGTVAVSPKGDEAIYSVVEQERTQVYVWSTKKDAKPQRLESTQNRAFQAFAYSPNGDRLIGGINGGIWLWARTQDWISQASPQEIPKVQGVRGQLASLQWIDNEHVLATSMLNGLPILYLLDLQGNQKASRLVTLPTEIAERITAVQVLAGNRTLYGLSDGSMLTGNGLSNRPPAEKSATSPIQQLVELPKKHRTAITRFIVNPKGEILSMSDEPVSHLWIADGKGSVSYDSYLTGAPSVGIATNLSQASFISDDVIVGVDGGGLAVAWDVARQKQRKQMVRISSSGQEEYASPVAGVFSRGQSQQAISVTEDGVVDVWSLRDGTTTKINEKRWSYFGHTPGAEFVDSAIDMESGLVVTSASLKNAERRYLEAPTHNWEFCVWDQKTGNMVRRWTEKTEGSVELRLSILESGKQILISNDKAIRIVDFTGSPVFRSDDLGTYFAIPNPTNPSQVAMVKRSGYTWLWDRNNPSSSMQNRPQLYVPDDENEDGVPLKGIWSSDGDRLYMAYSNGVIYCYENNKYHAQGWPRTKLWQPSSDTAFRVKYHYDLDIAMASQDSQFEKLYVNVRIPGNRPETRLTVIQFDPTTKKSKLVESESKTEQSIGWLDESNGKNPILSKQMHQRFKLNERSRDSVLSRVTVGQHTFVSTRSGKVFDLTDNAAEWVSMGRSKLLSTTAGLEGNVIWTIHNDGSLWKLELTAENRGEWKRAAWSAPGCIEIKLSPDGKKLAMLDNANVLKIVDATSGASMGEYTDVAAIIWDSTDVLIGYRDGTLARIRADGRDSLGSIELAEGSRILSLNLFNENWSDPNIATNRYLLVQTENDKEAFLNFVILNGKLDKLPKPLPVSKDLRIVTSPTDPVFVTGNSSGTVSVWFASPKWDRGGILFDLDGHRGSSIDTIAFSNDGYTLITADSNNRLYGWLSREVTIPQ